MHALLLCVKTHSSRVFLDARALILLSLAITYYHFSDLYYRLSTYCSYYYKLPSLHNYINKTIICSLYYTVLQPNITNITITPSSYNNNNFLLHQFNDTVSLTCIAEVGPRIMTRWQFDDGSTVETVANDSSSVTYEVSSLSTDHTGVYYCEAIIDGMTDTSMNYTLFGKFMYVVDC